MILQRMSSAIREQNWFQVTIEVLIVVIGIFLGLQVQTWYDGRLALEEEQRVIGYLISDMEKTADYFDEQLPKHKDQINLTARIIEIIESGELKPEDIASFEEGIVKHGRSFPLDAYVASFSEENLNHVQRGDMRKIIRDYIAIVSIEGQTLERIRLSLATPRFVTKSMVAVRQTVRDVEVLSAEERVVYYDFDQLVADADFRHAMINVNGSEYLMLRRYDIIREASALMLQILKNYQAGEEIEEVDFR